MRTIYNSIDGVGSQSEFDLKARPIIINPSEDNNKYDSVNGINLQLNELQKNNKIYDLAVYERIRDSFFSLISDCKSFASNVHAPVWNSFISYMNSVITKYNSTHPNAKPLDNEFIREDIEKFGNTVKLNMDELKFDINSIGKIKKETRDDIGRVKKIMENIYSEDYVAKNLSEIGDRCEASNYFMGTFGNYIMLAVCDNFLLNLRKYLGVNEDNPDSKLDSLKYECSFVMGIMEFNSTYFKLKEKLMGITEIYNVLLDRGIADKEEKKDIFSGAIKDFSRYMLNNGIIYDGETGISTISPSLLRNSNSCSGIDELKIQTFVILSDTRAKLAREFNVKINTVLYYISNGLFISL